MQESNAQTAQIIGMLVGAILIGIVCGLIPLITGIVRKHFVLGIVGLLSCTIGGFILGIILALPIAVIFTVIIATRKSSGNLSMPPTPPNNFQ